MENEQKLDALADAIVDDIVKDLTDRRGLNDAWDSIDADIREEIRQLWRQIVKSNAKAIYIYIYKAQAVLEALRAEGWRITR